MFGWDNLCFKLICETNARSGSERERVALAVKLIDSKGIEPRELPGSSVGKPSADRDVTNSIRPTSSHIF